MTQDGSGQEKGVALPPGFRFFCPPFFCPQHSRRGFLRCLLCVPDFLIQQQLSLKRSIAAGEVEGHVEARIHEQAAGALRRQPVIGLGQRHGVDDDVLALITAALVNLL